VNSAQTVYSQARADYESAVARELEETPAVVVVDPIPSRLLPDPRRVPLKLVLATALGLIAATIVLIAKREFTRRDDDAASQQGNGSGDLPAVAERGYRERVVATGD